MYIAVEKLSLLIMFRYHRRSNETGKDVSIAIICTSFWLGRIFFYAGEAPRTYMETCCI